MIKKFLFSLVFCFFIAMSVAFSAYIIENLAITNVIVSNNDDDTYHKVTFNGNSPKVLYLKNNSFITANDAPYLTDSNGYYVWKETKGSGVVFNDLVSDNANSIGSKVAVNRDMEFEPTFVSFPSSPESASDIGEIIETGRTVIDEPDDGGILGYGAHDDFRIEESSNDDFKNGNSNSEPAIKVNLDAGVYNNFILNSYINRDGEQLISNKFDFSDSAAWRHDDEQTNSDYTIALEDPTSAISSYKPKKSVGIKDGNSGTEQSQSRNYCVARISLTRDTILTGSTQLNLGALTGFYGYLNNWSQRNWQGYIIGQYNELDLCGHTLVVESGSSITAIGSITDSSPNKTGKIIMKSGSTLTATFVVEDQHHETAGPMTYVYGGPIFSMYKIPYLNCNIIFEVGSFLKGRMQLDYGGTLSITSGNTIYNGDINIIGDNDNYIFNLAKKGNSVGYLTRCVSYDNELEEKFNSEAKSIGLNNLMHQKITYNFENLDIRINLPSDMKASISGTDLHINFNYGMWFIPPYFDFNLFNTKALIKNPFVFMPGSTVNVDELSMLHFGYGGENKTTAVSRLGIELPSNCFVHVGSMIFLLEKYDFDESANGDIRKYNDSNDTPGTMMTNNSRVFSDTSVFWKHMNHKHASMNLNGSIKFDDIDASLLPNLGTGKIMPYQLGGIINIKYIELFKNEVDRNGNVKLVGDAFKSGPDRLTKKTGLIPEKCYRLNISDYFSLPVISNNNVLTDVDDVYTVRSDYYISSSYDLSTGLIKQNSSFYGYFPVINSNGNYNKTSLRHFFRANYSDRRSYYNGNDDLAGLYLKVETRDITPGTNSADYVTVNDTRVNFNNQMFAFFRGTFAELRMTSSGTFQINVQRYKMIDDNTTEQLLNAKRVNSNDSYYGHPARRLS